jgi:hypothetical protein
MIAGPEELPLLANSWRARLLLLTWMWLKLSSNPAFWGERRLEVMVVWDRLSCWLKGDCQKSRVGKRSRGVLEDVGQRLQEVAKLEVVVVAVLWVVLWVVRRAVQVAELEIR